MLSLIEVCSFELMLYPTEVSSSELLVSSLTEVGTNELLLALFDRGRHFGFGRCSRGGVGDLEVIVFG